MAKENNKRKGSVVGGIIVAWLIFIIEAGILYALSFAGIVGPIIGFILLLIVSLFIHGILGLWMIGPMTFAVNSVVKYIFTAMAYIGFFIRPFILMAYGSHKKSTLMLCTTLPLAILSVVLIVYNVLYGLGLTVLNLIGAIELLNCFFLLQIRKCPKCKCVMSEIDCDENYADAKYYENKSYEVGSVQHDDGSSSKVYAHVKYERNGKRTTYAKTFTCENCGTVKIGMKFSVLENF